MRIAVNLVEEGLIGPEEALARLHGIDLSKLTRTRVETSTADPIGRATVASLGVASGAIALGSNMAGRLRGQGTHVILVRRETTTADIDGIAEAAGILTATRVRTSHAAVVTRQLGKVCLIGCATLLIDLNKRSCRIAGQDFQEGDFLSLDGNDGTIYAGRLFVIAERPEREFAVVAGWRHALAQRSAAQIDAP